MFTGIIEEVGVIENIKHGSNSAILTIKAAKVLKGTEIGDSIAVNGICLTVTKLLGDGFTADVMHETLNRTSLSGLNHGSKVNLERAMLCGGRFGGHIVSGHVDGIGTVTAIKKDDNAIWFTIACAKNILRYIAEKGSITIDGISLTVAKVTDSDFAISAIPHTVKETILSEKKIGSRVNLETDIIGKYVEKLLLNSSGEDLVNISGENQVTDGHQNNKKESGSDITREFLTKYGF